MLGAAVAVSSLAPPVAAAGAKALDAAGGLKAATPVKVAQTTGVVSGIISEWDYTADVVVLGTGLAGLSTAITANDAGANVLVLEKLDQAHEGGNSKVAGNVFYAPLTANDGATYIKALQAGQLTDDTIINALSAGLVENLSVVKQMGASTGPFTTIGEFPMLPGGTTGGMSGIVVNGAVQLGGGYLYKLYRDAVSSRNIKVMYSTPATGLIQNGDTGEILGVTATSSSGTINIKASRAVILACGGFEFNQAMQSKYLMGYPIYGWGTPGDTGDGILMAQKAGADLSTNMTSPSGGSAGNAIVVADYPYPVGFISGYGIGNNYIWVGKDGNRFANESLGFASHGWGVKEYGLQFSGAQGAFLRIPNWVIFDDAARAKGPFVQTSFAGAPSKMGWFVWYSGYTWSSDNTAEIAKGWITKADTIANLAASIASDKDNLNPMGQPFMTASALQATITRFNGFVSAGKDTDFGRPAATMASMATAPFYAVKTWPAMVNTNGGPRRNVNCQVVDPSSNPIPRLYSAGECGSFWGWMYQGGGNLGECMWTGRVAGKNAAAQTPWL